jgi:environmental stress-induced protein Ves
MITKLTLNDLPETPWKSGKGMTKQIDIWPPQATIADNNFLWRLSSATVKSSDPFSSYPKCKRLLVVWQGDGLLLNEKPLLPHHVFAFSGDEKIECDLIGKTVIDLGLIYKKEMDASMEVFRTSETTRALSAPLIFLFLAEGQCTVGHTELRPGDLLKIEDESSVHIHANTPALFYQINLAVSVHTP